MSVDAVIGARVAAVAPAWARLVAEQGAGAVDGGGATGATDLHTGTAAIREGWRAHRAVSALTAGATPDVALLIGDWCYADGLVQVAEHGTLDDVARLASLVAELSVRHAEPAGELEALWSDHLDAAVARG